LLQVAAANKLLKIIEEPPADTLFILISANDDRILPTILSRTQLVKLSKINDFDMLTVLSEQYGVELERGRELVNMADGDFARAKRLVNMEDDHGAYLGFFQEWMRACYSGTFQQVVRLSDDFGKMGRDQQKAVVEYGLYLMRESLMFNSGADVLRITEKERHWLSKFAPVLTEDKLMATVEAMEKSVFHLARNAYAKLEFTALSLHIHRAFRQG
jgi:DNA polymerase-3 subunit delta'